MRGREKSPDRLKGNIIKLLEYDIEGVGEIFLSISFFFFLRKEK